MHEAAVGTEDAQAIGCHALCDGAAVVALPLERSSARSGVLRALGTDRPRVDPSARLRTEPGLPGCGLCPLPRSRKRGYRFSRSGYRQRGFPHGGRGEQVRRRRKWGKTRGKEPISHIVVVRAVNHKMWWYPGQGFFSAPELLKGEK